MGMLNSHRHTSTPTRATRPATTAVAIPPDQSRRASTRLADRPRPGGVIGAVISYLPSQLGDSAPAAGGLSPSASSEPAEANRTGRRSNPFAADISGTAALTSCDMPRGAYAIPTAVTRTVPV